MENKFKYFIVGFVFILFLSGFVFLSLWIYKGFGKEEYNTYLIETVLSVNGLDVGSPVKYKGVSVGKVSKIEIDWENPSIVRIYIDVDKRLKLTNNIYATLETQGITGLAFISLQELDKSMTKGVKEITKIPLMPSTFQQITNKVPDILLESHYLLKDIRKLIKNLDVHDLNNTLKNANETLIYLQSALEKMNENFDILTEKYSKLAQEIIQLTEKGNITLEESNKLIKELQSTVKSYKELSVELQSLSKDVKGQIPTLSDNIQNLSNKSERIILNIDKLIKKLQKEATADILIQKTTNPAPVEEKR